MDVASVVFAIRALFMDKVRTVNNDTNTHEKEIKSSESCIIDTDRNDITLSETCTSQRF